MKNPFNWEKKGNPESVVYPIYNVIIASTMKEWCPGSDFIMLDDPSVLGRSLIAGAKGIKPELVDDLEVKDLIASSGKHIDPYLACKYLIHYKQTDRASVQRELDENHQSVVQDAEILFGLRPSSFSYGLFAPSYIKELNRYKREAGSEEHRSLLVGALTVDSIRAFAGTMAYVFLNPEINITDISASERIQQFPGFVLSNGVQLPFKDGTFDTVQTNCLLHCIELPHNSYAREEARKLFFRNSFMALKVNGRLIMVEGNLQSAFDVETDQQAIAIIVNELGAAGFGQVEISPAKCFRSRKEQLDFFRSSSGRPELVRESVTHPYVATIVARK